jgi:hypothetical protein
MKRILISASSKQSPQPGESRWTEEAFSEIEQAHPQGLTTQQVLESFMSRGDRLTEASFRKYVQLGLLPRSVRIGRKGKHRGSQGLYPATVVRQIERIRRLMAQGLTIEEIQREFPFFGGDIDELSRQLMKVFSGIEQATSGELQADASDRVLQRAVEEARAAGEELIRKLRAIEERLLIRARMARAAV